MTLVIPYFAALTTYFSYGILFVFGHLRDWLKGFSKINRTPAGYAPLCRDFEDFYTRRLYRRIEDCWNRPIRSAPDAWIDVEERITDDNSDNAVLRRTGGSTRCLNVGSYNYLGFANTDPYCTQRVIDSVKKYGVSTCSPRVDGGTTQLHLQLEEQVARFVGKEAAMVCGMGFATNSTTIPALVGKGSLVISDSLNHSSIVAGVRGSGAQVKVFSHNEPSHLEQVLRESIAEGQPRTRRPWKKIVIIVEGVYSMEGEICRLPEIVELKKKYKAYLYLDEAHSIGAIGEGGKGVCQLLGVDPTDVDVMMGTFTKSFGSCGGYVGGSKELVSYLKHVTPSHLYATSMSPPAVEQVISALTVIAGEDGSGRGGATRFPEGGDGCFVTRSHEVGGMGAGSQKLAQLRKNCNWFRGELRELGFEVLGDDDSPVMPIMLYNPAKIAAFSRECLKRNLAVVVVGFPATPLLLSRARVCISASHSREDLEFALKVMNEVGDLCKIKYVPVVEMTTAKVV